MIPDPNTKEGMEIIKKRLEQRRKESEEVRERAENMPDEELGGELTNPNELDLIRDRKSDE